MRPHIYCSDDSLICFAFWPGILELGGKEMHAFDGHGLIARVSLQNGRAVFKSRYVKTKVVACPVVAVVQQNLLNACN